MVERIRRVVIILIVCVCLFWVGFKTGLAYNRTKNKIAVEKIRIEMEEPAPPQLYYIVEHFDYGTYKRTEYREEGRAGLIMRLFFNEKLRHLLKAADRDFEIYSPAGDRIY